jgi:glyoxylase-like metal-dependent hydrolase (beta-lactamase superfamily II)
LTQLVEIAEQTGAPWIRIAPVRTPTLPPATHTNVYILGQGRLAIIDAASPYPDEQTRLDALVAALERGGETVAELVLTHHHPDHVSGAMHLAARLGVGIAAHRATADKLAGRVTVTRTLAEDELLPYGPRGFRALFTPGHAPGHLCFVDEASRAVVAGDMVASVGTIIVEPDDGGDMRVYLDSLARLRALDASALLPAHGPPITDANAKLDFYVHHRLEREGRVLAALTREPQTLTALVPPAYPDVPPAIHPLAARSLYAHLLKLEFEGRTARDDQGRWRLV